MKDSFDLNKIVLFSKKYLFPSNNLHKLHILTNNFRMNLVRYSEQDSALKF
jgi:hypothetical protein